jgi:hypothetical protein
VLLAFINLSGPIRKRQEFPELIDFIVLTTTVALQRNSPDPVGVAGWARDIGTRLAMGSA